MAKGVIEKDSTSIAAEKVYKSSIDVFSNKQRNLYKKTLNILKRFTLECSFENIEESLHTQSIKFWFKDILPLLFDADDEIREAAIDAVSAFVPQLKFTKYQTMTIWNSTKTAIVDKYSKEIENLRTAANDNWHKIWCLLIQILDGEIVKSAVLINIFLNIAERGFRSSDLKIRAESFVCWRMLVQIFAKHRELENPKRIKLICIPLKSSKSKTAQIAENKFYVWWYLICQFYKNVDTIVGSVVEPFLFFCFGPMGKILLASYLNDGNMHIDDVIAPAKTHPKVKLMAIVAFNQFLGSNNKKIAEFNKQLQLTVPGGTITYTNTFNTMTTMLISSCTEATVLLTDRDIFSVPVALDINRSMWTSLMSKMDYNACVETSKLIKENILALICVQKHLNNHDLPLLIRDVVDVTGTCEQFPFGKAAIDHLGSADQILAILRDHCDILLNNDIAFDDSNEQQHRIIKHIFTMEKFQHKPYYRNLIMDLIGFITKDLVTPMNRATVNYTVVASIWNAGAYTLIDFIKSNKQFCCDLEDGKKILLDYLVWPCENIEKFDYLQIHTTFEKLFNQILKLFHDNVNEIIELASTLIQAVLIVKYNVGIEKVAELFVKIIRPMKHDFDGSSKPYHTFCLIENIVKNSTKHRRIGDAVKQLVDEFMKFVVAMNYKSFFLSILNVKNVISELALLKDFDMKTIKNQLLQKFRKQEFINELKIQGSQEKWYVEQLVKTYRENEVTAVIWKNYLQKIMEICVEKSPSTIANSPKTPKSTPENFVVIQSVWKMNPEKLTEHQREKMKERRSDIPALYNDMSQSQDSFIIKAWKPNKVVVPHTDDHDTIVMLPSDSSNTATTSYQVPKDKENNSNNNKRGRRDEDEVVNVGGTPDKNAINANKVAYLTRTASSLLESKNTPKKNDISDQEAVKTNTPAKATPSKEQRAPTTSEQTPVKAVQLETPSKKKSDTKATPSKEEKSPGKALQSETPLKKTNDPKPTPSKMETSAPQMDTPSKKINDAKPTPSKKEKSATSDSPSKRVSDPKVDAKSRRKGLPVKKKQINVKRIKQNGLKKSPPSKVKKLKKKPTEDSTDGEERPVENKSATPLKTTSTVDKETPTAKKTPYHLKKLEIDMVDTPKIKTRRVNTASVTRERNKRLSLKKVTPRKAMTDQTLVTVIDKDTLTTSSKNNEKAKTNTGEEKNEELATGEPNPAADTDITQVSASEISETPRPQRSATKLGKADDKSQSPPRKRIDFDDLYGQKVKTLPTMPTLVKPPSPEICVQDIKVQGSPSPPPLTHHPSDENLYASETKTTKDDSNEIVESSQQSESIFTRKVSSRRSYPSASSRSAKLLSLANNLTAAAADESNTKAASPTKTSKATEVVDDTLPLDSESIDKIQELMADERQKRLKTSFGSVTAESVRKSPIKAVLVVHKMTAADVVDEDLISIADSDVSEIAEKPRTPQKTESERLRLLRSEADTEPNTEQVSESVNSMKTPEKSVKTEVDDSIKHSLRKSPRKINYTEVVNLEDSETDEKPVKVPTPPTRSSPRKPTTAVIDIMESSDTDDDVILSSIPTILATRASPRKSMTTTDAPERSTPQAKKPAVDNKSPLLSPIRAACFEENEQLAELPVLNKSNKSIVSSPEPADNRDIEMLNDTLNISPIEMVVPDEDVEATTSVAKLPFIHLSEKDTRTSSPIDRKLRFRAQQSLPESPRLQPNTKFTFNSPSTSNRSSHTGRGAQLINMIMSKRNLSSPKPRNAIHKSESLKISPSGNIMTAAKDETDKDGVHYQKDFLTFTKELPTRTASPSVSILKRKHLDDSLDNDFESPAQKRKRVSFLDPPVSSTKEYLLYEHERRANADSPHRPLSNRCLNPQPDDAPAAESPKCLTQPSTSNTMSSFNLSGINLNPKIVLTRKSRAESIIDLVKYTNNNDTRKPTSIVDDDEDAELDVEIAKACNMTSSTVNMSALQMNDTTFGEEDEPELVALRRTSPRNQIKFDNEADMYKYAFEKLTLDEILEKHAACSSAKKGVLSADTVRLLTKEIINVTKVDKKIRQTVLDDFSEEHPEEFLDHAVQENSSEVVCRRLPINSILDFVFAESKANEQMQARVLTEVEQILSSGGDAESNVARLTGFLQKVLEVNCLSSDAISKMIITMFANRPKAETFDLLQNLQRLIFRAALD